MYHAGTLWSSLFSAGVQRSPHELHNTGTHTHTHTHTRTYQVVQLSGSTGWTFR